MRALVVSLLLITTAATAQPPSVPVPPPQARSEASSAADSAVFMTGDGQPAQWADVLNAADHADVVILGEQHDDAVAHALELRILGALMSRARPVVLSLEMIETDTQTVLDEYLARLVRKSDWLAASRPWSNYETDYRPLVETARSYGLPVVAANAPSRYVSAVSRRGDLSVLDELSPEARAQLPPVVAPPSEALAEKFTALMGGMAHGAGPSVAGMLEAQNLRDATMAWRISEALAAHPGAVVVHVNGSFHSADRLGVPEHLARLAPDARVVVVTMDREPADEPTADDFVILTTATVSR